MSERSPGSGEPGNEEWPDDLWSAPAWRPRPGRPERRIRPAFLVVIALVATLVGAGIALAAKDLSGASGNAAEPGSQPSYLVPWPPGNRQPVMPGDGAGATAEFFLVGQVRAVSKTSITIGLPGRSITAAVTPATRVTGNTSSISGIKVGERISAQITRSRGRYTATAIQHPPRSPSGITAP